MVAVLRSGDHSCAHRLRDLDRDRAYTARAAMDEDRLADGELSSRHQGLPDRSADERQARRLQVAEVLRLATDEVDIGDVLLGVRAGAAEDLGRVVHLIAGAELADVRSDFLDHPGDVMPDDRRQRHQVHVVSATDLIVERIDSGRMDTHPHLTRSDVRNRDIPQLERIGPSETGEHNGLHHISHHGVPHRGFGDATPRVGRFAPSVAHTIHTLQWRQRQYPRGS